jgi:PAS domain-containing protein
MLDAFRACRAAIQRIEDAGRVVTRRAPGLGVDGPVFQVIRGAGTAAQVAYGRWVERRLDAAIRASPELKFLVSDARSAVQGIGDAVRNLARHASDRGTGLTTRQRMEVKRVAQRAGEALAWLPTERRGATLPALAVEAAADLSAIPDLDLAAIGRHRVLSMEKLVRGARGRARAAGRHAAPGRGSGSRGPEGHGRGR